MTEMNTTAEFQSVMQMCRELFAKKLHDYGAAWRIMRPASITDQLYIKANRTQSWIYCKSAAEGSSAV